MRKRSQITFTVSLAILAAICLPVIAQSQRYPTDAEVQRLIARFRQHKQVVADERTPLQIRIRDTFVRAWSQSDSSIAPFLGEWFSVLETSYAQSLMIYPSSSRGRVCIIHGYFPDGDDPSSFLFAMGSVSNGQIRIDRGDLGRSLVIKQGNDLALLGIYKSQGADIWKFSYPKPLKQPTIPSLQNKPEAAKIIQQFNVNGCTAYPPESI
ncbi:hypothetical protein [Aerosakkonema funiforme]|uniref:hypothetical protein n=1 Tax=Aerosakkonema funiforme TaxID=1246630 RepID=UPI0035B6F139